MEQPPQASAGASQGAGLAVWMTLAGAALVVVGSFLPWGTVSFPGGSLTESGMDVDGWISLILGLAIAAAGALALVREGLASIAVIVLGALTVLLGIYELTQINDAGDLVPPGVDVSVGVGIGIWLLIIGAAGAIVAGVLGRRST